jgi:PTS system nitrogen regulatory IIA component
MEILDVFSKDCCRTGAPGRSKEEILRVIADQACKSRLLENFTPQEIYEKLSERESQGSTGFGGEVAIPHARIEGVEDFLVFIVTSSRGADFEALDKKRVKLFFVILGPQERVNDHLKILAALSRIAGQQKIRNELIKASTVTALYESFVRNTGTAEGPAADKVKMKLLLVNLYVEEFLYNILEFFIEEGIEGATILESFGMGEYISNIPLFAEFIGFMQKSKNQSKTILVLVPEDKISDTIRGIEEITGDLDKKQGAMVMVLDIAFYKGSMKML